MATTTHLQNEHLKTGGNEPVGSTLEEFDARVRAGIATFADNP